MLEQALKQMYDDINIPHLCGWDERYRAALIVLQPADAEAILPNLDKAFEKEWDHTALAEATGDVKQLASHFSGSREGQMLYTKQVDSGIILYAAYWPWVGGSHISVRFGAFRLENCTFTAEDVANNLKAIFLNP